MIVSWIVTDINLSIEGINERLKGMEKERAASATEVDKLWGGTTHNLNHVGTAFWTLETTLISQPLIGTSMTENEFTLLSTLIGHVVLCETRVGFPLTEDLLGESTLACC